MKNLILSIIILNGGKMSTQFLGLFGDIVNSIGNAFSGIANWINDKIGDQIDAMLTIIMKLVYEILKVFFIIIDFVQLVFRKMAGLDTVYLQDGTEHNNDLALLLFKNEAVQSALIALTVTAVVLVFVVTFVAIIRSHYTAKEAKDTAVGPIIGKAFKAIFSFIFVPIVCYFGVYVSNGLLKTVDEATRVSGALTISGEVFATSAMNANRARIDKNFLKELTGGMDEQTGQQANKETPLNPDCIFNADNSSQYITSKSSADKIDRAFASKMKAPEDTDIVADADTYRFMYRQSSPGKISNFDYMNTDLVFVYYDLLKFNWLFAFVSCFFVTATLLVSAMGIIQRLFEITILFAISPPFIAIMPLDNGNAFKMWTRKFINATLIMYGTVIALNFFFIIAPVLQSINLFGSENEIATYGKLTCDLFNGIAHILFIMCGSLVIKDFTDLVNQLVTGDKDAKNDSLNKRGANVGKEIQGNMAKGLQTMDATYGRAKRKWNDYHSAENVQKRKEAKEQKAADNAGVEAAVMEGKVGTLGAMAMKRDLARQRKGKGPSLLQRTRSAEFAQATKEAHERGQSEYLGMEKDPNTGEIKRSGKGAIDVAEANASRYNRFRLKSTAGSARREASKAMVNKYRNDESGWTQGRKDYVHDRDDWVAIDKKRRAAEQQLIQQGYSKSEARKLSKQSARVQSTSTGRYSDQSHIKQNMKQHNKDFKKDRINVSERKQNKKKNP